MSGFKSVYLVLIIGTVLEGVITVEETLNFTLPDAMFVFADKKKGLVQICETSAEVKRFQWLNPRNEPITYMGRIHVEEADRNRLILEFNTVELGDQGNYTCVAALQDGTISKTFMLKVLKPIEFVDTPLVQYAKEGERGGISCYVDGAPVLTINWKPKHAIRKIHFDKYQETANEFVILNVTREDAGVYNCEAFQTHPEKTHYEVRAITFIVKYAPEWIDPIVTEVVSFVMGVVNLTCSASGQPMPEIHWRHGDQHITPEPGGQYSIISTNGSSILQVHINDESDFGSYTCVAGNEIDEIHRDIIIKKGAKPRVPFTSAKVFQTNGIELGITSPKEDVFNILEYKVQYKLKGQTWNKSHYKIFGIGEPYIITDLKEDTEYEIRVAARYAAGYSDYSQTITQRTFKLMSTVGDTNGAVELKQPHHFASLISCICYLLCYLKIV